MTEDPEVSVLTARRAPQHVRLYSADDAYEHLCILTLLSSLGPIHLMLADTSSPRGSDATLCECGDIVRGLRTVRCLPALPRRLRAMGRTVCSIPPCQTIIPTAFRSHSGLPTIHPESPCSAGAPANHRKLSCRALSSPTTYRFIPALSVLPTTHAKPASKGRQNSSLSSMACSGQLSSSH